MCVFSLCVVFRPGPPSPPSARKNSEISVVSGWSGHTGRMDTDSGPGIGPGIGPGVGPARTLGELVRVRCLGALNSDSALPALYLLSTYVYLRLTATYLGTMVTRRVGRPRRIYSLESRRVSRGTVGSTGWSRVRVAATQTTGGLVVTLRCFPGFGRVWGMGHVVMRSDGSWRMCWIRRLPV